MKHWKISCETDSA